jgi:hypothetical protein
VLAHHCDLTLSYPAEHTRGIAVERCHRDLAQRRPIKPEARRLLRLSLKSRTLPAKPAPLFIGKRRIWHRVDSAVM